MLGIANHLIPYRLTAAVVRRLKPDLDDEAIYKITAGVVLFPLCWHPTSPPRGEEKR